MAEKAAAAEVAAPSEAVEAEAPASEASWTDGLNETSQGFVQNKGWDSAEQMLDSYQNLEKSMGAPADRVLNLPSEENPEGWNEVYDRLGRPEDAASYKLNDLSEGDVPDGGINLSQNLRDWAYQAGLSQDQAASIYDNYSSRIADIGREMEQQKIEKATADEQDLRREWGEAWDENISVGRRFIQRFEIDKPTLAKLEDSLGFSGLLKLSAEIGRGLGEHSDGGANANANAAMFGMTPATAQAKINDLTLDKDFMSKYMEGNKEAIDRMTRLHSVAHPDVADS
jgi:hypothetical protein